MGTLRKASGPSRAPPGVVRRSRVLDHFAQPRQAGVGSCGLVLARGVIPVDPALGAQPLAVRTTKRLQWETEQHVFARERAQVEQTGFGDGQQRLRCPCGRVNEQVVEVDLQPLAERGQAADTLGLSPGLHPARGVQALGRAGQAEFALQIRDVQVVTDLDAGVIELEETVVPDRLVEHEPDVEAQRLTGQTPTRPKGSSQTSDRIIARKVLSVNKCKLVRDISTRLCQNWSEHAAVRRRHSPPLAIWYYSSSRTADNIPTLLLATTNPGKLSELRALLSRPGVDLTDLYRPGIEFSVPQEGADYAANAVAKALAYAQAAGLWTLADDTGLEVDALGGAPGLRSARPAEGGAARRASLLQHLAAHPRPWTARFRCAVALASPEGETATGHGVCEGEITPVARGDNGFGYDPLFVVAGTGKTMAELTFAEKNRLGHRAGAVEDLHSRLRQGELPNAPLSESFPQA